ncbi:MAG: lysophospholipid acyltransferase family protein [bacterium]|nr:lysophospholipid acyltransferase family protein [bacterium]MDT8365302.1 lysophospholipid acyltransferase family protein [bacterium]
MRYQLETVLLWILGTVFRILPRRTGLFLGRVVGSMAYYLAPRRRNLALENLTMALGESLSEKEIRTTALASFRFLGMNILEFFNLSRATPEEMKRLTSVEGEEHLIEALASGKGALILTAHLGSWDMLGAGLAARGYPVALITKVSRSEAVNRIWMGYREKAGIKLFMGRGTMKESLRHLKNGGMVGLVQDQNARRREGVFVPFFGREACTITSLALLARRTGAPVVPLYSYRDGNIHRIVIEKIMLHDNIADTDTDLLERTRSYTQWTEKIVRLHPQQWTWLHDRWKTRPRP